MVSNARAELRAVAKAIKRFDRLTTKEVSKVVTKGALNIKKGAIKNLARTKSNDWLIAAMSYDLGSAGVSGLSAEIGPDQSISGLGLGREFGSSKTPPHPFLFPAADVEEPKFLDAVENAVAKAYTL